MQTFADVLRGLREGKGWTQEKLAKKSGVNRVQIARLETSRCGASWRTVQLLARALGVSCEAFQEKAKK